LLVVAPVELRAGGVGAADEANLRRQGAGVEELKGGIQPPVAGVNPDPVAGDELVVAEEAFERGLGRGRGEAGVAFVADGGAVNVVGRMGVVDVEVGRAVGDDADRTNGIGCAIAIANEADNVARSRGRLDVSQSSEAWLQGTALRPAR